MAKRQKRQVSGGSRTISTPASPSSTYTPTPSVRRVSMSTEFNPDYSNVKADMKRIGVLAGSFFGILIILSFFLR